MDFSSVLCCFLLLSQSSLASIRCWKESKGSDIDKPRTNHTKRNKCGETFLILMTNKDDTQKIIDLVLAVMLGVLISYCIFILYQYYKWNHRSDSFSGRMYNRRRYKPAKRSNNETSHKESFRTVFKRRTKCQWDTRSNG